MNKELTPLEALNKIKKKHYFVDFELDTTVGKDCKKELDIIETALKRLEEIDKYLYLNNKKLKALEIIKEKRVNVGLLSRCATVERYNKGVCYEPRHLTQEECDLLKEVLA